MRFRANASLTLVIALLLCAAAAQQPQAQPGQQPARPRFQLPQPKNLKVLPKDISSPELLDTMKKFALSLGVRCHHCHVGEEGQPLDTYDFASDAKRQKENARVMLLMVQQINAESLPKLKMNDPPEPVTCYTCHRGKTEPESEVPMPNMQPKQPEPKPETKQ